MNSYIENWFIEKENSLKSNETKENYEEWKISFPKKRIDDITKKIEEHRNDNTN